MIQSYKCLVCTLLEGQENVKMCEETNDKKTLINMSNLGRCIMKFYIGMVLYKYLCFLWSEDPTAKIHNNCKTLKDTLPWETFIII